MDVKSTDTVFRRFIYLHGRDNFTERVVNSFTLWILLFATILLSSKLIFGDIITCWVPPETPDSWSNYYHDYCFYQDKYRLGSTFAPKADRIHELSKLTKPATVTDANEIITYYQWIPYTLIFQMFLCLLPSLIWKHIGLRYFHGCDFDAILRSFIKKMPEDGRKMEVERWVEESAYKKMSKEVYNWLKMKKRNRLGMHSTMIVYVSMKWASFLMMIIQFWIISTLYGNGQIQWGIHVTYNLLYGLKEDIHGGIFPRIVGCNVHRLNFAGTVQEQFLPCLLLQNFVNEKVFMFLYWWFLFAAFVSFCSACRFMALLLSPKYQRYTTKAMLPPQEYFLETTGGGVHSSVPGDNDLLEYFIDFLGCDGFLLLQLIADMLHQMSVRNFSRELWRHIIVQDEENENGAEAVGDANATAPPLSIDGSGDNRRMGAKKSKDANRMTGGEERDSEKKPLLETSSRSSTARSSPNMREKDNNKAAVSTHELD